MSYINQHITILRRRIITLNRIQGAAWGVVVVGISLAALGLIDYMVHWPMVARGVIFLAGLVVAWKSFTRWFKPIWNNNPTKTSIAIRLEEVEPILRGTLASAVDFESVGLDKSDRLAAGIVEKASQLWKSTRPNKHIRRLPIVRATLAAWIIVGLWLFCYFMQKQITTIALVRTLAPWSQTEWPPRILIHSEISLTHIAKGETFILRARADDDQDALKIIGVRVDAVCEIKDKNGVRTIKKLEMVPQSDGSWERPIVAEGETMSLTFHTDDTTTTPTQITVVEPPTIVGARLSIYPPKYAEKYRESINLQWGGGVMPTLPAVLAGGTATLEIKLSAPVVPTLHEAGHIDPAWLARTITAIDTENNAPINNYEFKFENSNLWKISWSVNSGIDIVVDPSDENGIKGQQPLRARIQVVVDQTPTVVVSDPEQDEVVTNKATVSAVIEARDDLELVSVGIRLDRQQRSGEPTPTTIKKTEKEANSNEFQYKQNLELASMDIQNGDTLLLRGIASDQYEKDGEKRQATLSEPRRIRIVDKETFEQNIRQQTNILRQNITRLEMGQKENINEQKTENTIQTQKSLSDRIEQAQKTTQRLTKRLSKNGMKDSNIAEALNEVDQQATRASSHSQNASQQLQKTTTGDSGALQKARKEQSETLQAIQAMLDILDRDDDAAGAQRRTEKLGETISKLRKDLQQVAPTTAGRTVDEMSPTEKSKLRDQAQKQREAAQEARALIEDLHDRAKRNKEKDPAQSQSLRAAAQEGDKADVEKQMEEAADRSEMNQTGAADDSMQAAAEAVEKIQKILKADRKAKNEEFKRRLSSLIETIKGLIVLAESGRNEIDNLENAEIEIKNKIEKNIERLAQNIAATIDESKGAGKTTQEITTLLERASEFENQVVVALRATPYQIDVAKDASSRGLELLKEALAKAQDAKQKQQEEESEKEREDLAKKYREFSQIQKTLREDVALIIPPDTKELNRRTAAVSREISEREKTLRGQVGNIPNQSDIVKEASVFVRTHQLIDEWMGLAQDQLSQSNPTAETVGELDFVVDALDALATALTDPEQKEDPFSQNNSGGGEGGGAAEQKKKIPPLAELRLVRELQAQINRRTKLIEEVGANAPGAQKSINDISKLQNDVRVLGEEWVEKMKKASQNKDGPQIEKQDKKINKQTMDSGNTLIYGIFYNKSSNSNSRQQTPPPPNTEPSTPNTPINTPEPKSDTPSEKKTKTLDELLGVGGFSAGENAAQAQRKEKLESGLDEKTLNDLAEAAIKDIQLAQRLVSQDRDIGIGTQRVQAQALSRLDALIDAAVQFEKSASQKPSKKKSKKDKSESKPGDEKKPGGSEQQENGQPKPSTSNQSKSVGSETNKGDDRDKNDQSGDKINPPEFEDAQLESDSNLEEGRSEWGHLPQRIREIMSQSRRDRISALYQKATEAYYRRMAEERGP